jgi:hypothetical protein
MLFCFIGVIPEKRVKSTKKKIFSPEPLLEAILDCAKKT